MLAHLYYAHRENIDLSHLSHEHISDTFILTGPVTRENAVGHLCELDAFCVIHTKLSLLSAVYFTLLLHAYLLKK